MNSTQIKQAAKQKKRILVLHTGGTFGAEPCSLETTKTLTMQHLPLSTQLHNRIPEIFEIADLEIRVLFGQDSSNLHCANWAALAREVETAWQEFDSFIIIHGTDTLAYCASFFSLVFANLTKPIVITGSQRPLAELRSDARMNMIDSVQLATLGYAEVFVCFNSDVFLASRVSKVSNLNLGAFHSPNFPKLGHFGVEILLNDALLPNTACATTLPPIDLRTDARVICLGVAPGLQLPKKLRHAILDCSAGLIFEGFGLGHAPTNECSWVDLAREAHAAEIPVIMTSQCRAGRVDMSLYEVGRELANQGVVSAHDMTPECATIKLMMLLGRRVPFGDRAHFMNLPLAREVTPPNLTHHALTPPHQASAEEDQ